jgi:curli biogenesis system outer membrane secretion channel CsgG
MLKILKRSQKSSLGILLFALCIVAIETPASAQESVTEKKKADDKLAIERCDAPKGTIALNEPQDYVSIYLRERGLTSPLPLLRLFIEKSNCFQVVERGRAFQNIKQERALAESGELQSTSNIGKGQLVVADFVMTPDVVVSSRNTGGIGGAVGTSLLGPIGGLLGGTRTRKAQTSLLIADVRSGLQVASATGQSKKTDFAIGGLAIGGGVGGALGGYTNTPQGKVIAASFLDNWNEVVRIIREKPSLIAPVSESSQINAGGSLAANAFNAGDVLKPKIAGIKLLSAPNNSAKEIAALTQADQMVFEGGEQNGFLKVVTPRGSGWISKLLVSK